MEPLWTLAADVPWVVVEANFRPHDPYQRKKLSALAEHPVEGYCQCDPQLVARRYDGRAGTSHPVHVIASVPPEVRAEYDQPVRIGKLVTVNTAIPVDVVAVATAVRAHLPTTIVSEPQIR